MENFQYSVQLSDQDWAEFSAAAEECGLLQASLASGDELLSSDTDQRDSSGSSPSGPPPFLEGQLAPGGSAWPGFEEEGKAAIRQRVSRSWHEPTLALEAGQQLPSTSALSEARPSPSPGAAPPAQGSPLLGPVSSTDGTQRLLQGPAPRGPAAAPTGAPIRSPEAPGCRAAPQKPPGSPGAPPRGPSRNKRRAAGTKGGGGRPGGTGPAPAQLDSPLLTEARPEDGLSPTGSRRKRLPAGTAEQTAGAGQIGLGPEPAGALEQVARQGPGVAPSTPVPTTEQGTDLLGMTPRAEPCAMSMLDLEVPLDVTMAKSDAALSTPASEPQPEVPLSTPASEPQPEVPLSTPASEPQPEVPLSTPASEPQPEVPLSTPASEPQPEVPLSTPASEPQPDEPLSTPASEPQPEVPLSTPASEPQPEVPLSTPASEPQPEVPLSTPASEPQPEVPLSTPASEPQPEVPLSTPASEPQPEVLLSTPTSKLQPNKPQSMPASKPQPNEPLSTPASKPRLDVDLLMPGPVVQPEVDSSTPVSKDIPRTALPHLVSEAKSGVGVCTPAPIPQAGPDMVEVEVAPVAKLGLSPVRSPEGGRQKPRGEPSAGAPGHHAGEPPVGPTRAPKKKKVRFSMAVPSPKEPGSGEASGPPSSATAPRTAAGGHRGSGAWDAVAVGPRTPQPRILKHLPRPAPSASAGPGPRSCFAVTLPEAYEFFFCDTIEEEDEDVEEEAEAGQALAEVQWPDVCEFFFREGQTQRSRHWEGRSQAPPLQAEPAAPPLGDAMPISIPEAYEHFLGEDTSGGTLGPAALLQMQATEPARSVPWGAGTGTPPEPSPASAEQLTLAVRQAGEPRGPLTSFTFSQNDMCLVFVAFATWAVRTSDLHAPDAWKTVLLANIGTISAIRYFRRQVGRGHRSRSPSPSS
ncbi:PGC-1 and ERR-induced regulator in muscle protein 1 [Hippopotamus amphibius kiboko]|uniref:PGC-1 and ERR-induced regulator in muscle protein 1 n=1 Tax=Hippopotamus amphibius kiboko TaxID=575201 RepID=UPI002591A36D|nr:PGC-1 and ERR-induced regulator in muscle protein 1 [Hippopotamus amphibius kiboko]